MTEVDELTRQEIEDALASAAEPDDGPEWPLCKVGIPDRCHRKVRSRPNVICLRCAETGFVQVCWLHWIRLLRHRINHRGWGTLCGGHIHRVK